MYSEFQDYLGVPDVEVIKGGMRATFAEHALALHKEHADMARFHKGLHDGLDDEHEMKPMHKRLSEHHAAKAAIYKSLHEDLGGNERGGESSGFGETTGDLDGPRGKAIRPDGIRAIYPSEPPEHLRMIPRGGAPSVEKAAVSAENEEMFDV